MHTISLSPMHQYGRTSFKNMNYKKITREMMKSYFAMASGETPVAANLRTTTYSSMCLGSDYWSEQYSISLHGDSIVNNTQWFDHDVRKNQWQGWGSWRQFIRINASIQHCIFLKKEGQGEGNGSSYECILLLQLVLCYLNGYSRSYWEVLEQRGRYCSLRTVHTLKASRQWYPFCWQLFTGCLHHDSTWLFVDWVLVEKVGSASWDYQGT